MAAERTFPSSEWLVRVFSPIVQPPTAFLALLIAEDFHGAPKPAQADYV